VSNVAIYSLKAKVGKLEIETKKLNEKVQQLEKDKAALSLLKTELSTKVTQLTSDKKALITHRKKLIDEVQQLKTSEGDSKLKSESPKVTTETLERETRNSTILSLSTAKNVSVPMAERQRSKRETKKRKCRKLALGGCSK